MLWSRNNPKLKSINTVVDFLQAAFIMPLDDRFINSVNPCKLYALTVAMAKLLALLSSVCFVLTIIEIISSEIRVIVVANCFIIDCKQYKNLIHA